MKVYATSRSRKHERSYETLPNTSLSKYANQFDKRETCFSSKAGIPKSWTFTNLRYKTTAEQVKRYTRTDKIVIAHIVELTCSTEKEKRNKGIAPTLWTPRPAPRVGLGVLVTSSTSLKTRQKRRRTRHKRNEKWQQKKTRARKRRAVSSDIPTNALTHLQTAPSLRGGPAQNVRHFLTWFYRRHHLWGDRYGGTHYSQRWLPMKKVVVVAHVWSFLGAKIRAAPS